MKLQFSKMRRAEYPSGDELHITDATLDGVAVGCVEKQLVTTAQSWREEYNTKQNWVAHAYTAYVSPTSDRVGDSKEFEVADFRSARSALAAAKRYLEGAMRVQHIRGLAK